MYIIIVIFAQFNCVSLICKVEQLQKTKPRLLYNAVLYLYIASIAKHTVRNDFGNYCNFVRAISIEPFHDDGKNTVQIEFNYVGSLCFWNAKAIKYWAKNMIKHFAVHFVHPHQMKLFRSYFEQTLVVLDEGQVWQEILVCNKQKLLALTSFKL